MTPKPIPESKHPLVALKVPKGPQYLKRDLAAYRAHFEQERTTVLPALWAISLCVAAEWSNDAQENPDQIQIPYWAAQAIAIGFNNYREAHETGRTTTLGEAFGLEGGGQGKPRKFDCDAKDHREKLIALDIVRSQQQGQSRKDAIGQACNKFEIDERTAQRHLKRWEALVKRHLAIYLGDNSSGSDVTP